MERVVIKIGIVLNYKAAEKKKDELFNMKSKEYLKSANDPEYRKYTIKKGNKILVPDDVAIGMYIENLPQNDQFEIIVDYITPAEISLRRFKQNDIVFVIIYDLLECFHLGSKKNYQNYKHALKNSGNVYPPYAYQKFINNKCNYYSYLKKKDIVVAPTQCITKYKWYTRDTDSYVNKLIKKVEHNKWDSIIAKPVYGQESLDFEKFKSKPECQREESCGKPVCKNSLVCQKGRLKKYLNKNIPKYKSIIIQEYIPGFDEKNPEYRTFFIDGIYAYTIVTTDHYAYKPKQEGGTYNVPQSDWNYLMKFTQQVMENLPKFDLPGLHRNPILTRIDVGTGLPGVPKTFFVNEVEFVPSLYIEKTDFPVIEEIAHSLIFVAMEYRFANKEVKVKF